MTGYFKTDESGGGSYEVFSFKKVSYYKVEANYNPYICVYILNRSVSLSQNEGKRFLKEFEQWVISETKFGFIQGENV